MQNIDTSIIICISLVVIGITAFFYTKSNKKTSNQHKKQDQQNNVTEIKLRQNKQQKVEQSSQTKANNEIKKQKKKKNKANKQASQNTQNKLKTQTQLQQKYADIFYGVINLKPQQNSMHGPVSISYKNSKILVSTTKNELILYDLKKWKKDNPQSLQKYFVSLDNNTATAVCFGKKYYYAALNFDKTIVYYQFIGQKGQYFRQIKKFNRNILKSDASSIYVPQDQKYIITSGSQADATISVWSLKGQKLYLMNTYQIQHYDIQYSLYTIMVRGWTSQVKLFEIQNDKLGNFCKIQKSNHLALQDQPLCSSIDNLGLYIVTVSKQYQTILWDIKTTNSSKMQLKIVQPYQIQLDQITNCLVHTLKNQNQRLKTLIILSGNQKIVICDQKFNVHEIIQGIECKEMQIIGSVKNVVLISRSKGEKLYVWNLTKLVEEKFQEYMV